MEYVADRESRRRDLLKVLAIAEADYVRMSLEAMAQGTGTYRQLSNLRDLLRECTAFIKETT